MNNYQIQAINSNVYSINDPFDCTTYLIIGDQKAMVIDLGMNTSTSLLSIIQKITTKELVVVLTHGHFDHCGHLKEFKEVYIDFEDFPCIEQQKENLPYLSNLKPLHHEMIFDLGNYIVKAIQTPGHTKGSVTFIDEKNHFLFTGDQFGSGCGVWMQVKEALPLSLYAQSIDNFIQYLKTHYDFPFENWTYFGGHLGQEKTGKLGYNPLNSEMVQNLKILSTLLLEKKCSLSPSQAKSFTNKPSYYACYKNAEMIVAGKDFQ